ncbi:MAG: fibronectin type III domain-containing protein, partial [Acetivibrio sp.]
SNKRGQVTISYQKDKSVSGYEIIYATNSKFSKNKKTKKINKPSTSKVTISGLNAGQIYYFKVRSYVLVNNKKVYGELGYSDYTWVKK